ncbi:hypothetical protein KQX54_020362 [Cotesia glomerata]|uniref:Uncharacterized protein n=1 Tax=Cotesia glomerata TaxID=32391 RepID=A0AAV7IG30_COTGL|nr:hypothetical protein KQX54_020362 [Cotesia glomerata]
MQTVTKGQVDLWYKVPLSFIRIVPLLVSMCVLYCIEDNLLYFARKGPGRLLFTPGETRPRFCSPDDR